MRRTIITLISVYGSCILPALHSEETGSILNPNNWPVEQLRRLEEQQCKSWKPDRERITSTSGGLIAATVSPISVEAGIRALDAGGTAADAAVTVALTQIATELGSVVSYAGIMTALYYEADTGKVTALDAGFDSYAEETNPLSIPAADLRQLRPGESPQVTEAHGRKTLVPGFMAGVEALHARYGTLPFKDLFVPAITYAEQGIVMSPILEGCFNTRVAAFQRTEEGRAFLAQSGGEVPKAGERFVQLDLAKTLHAVADNGAQEMYRGEWAKKFVEIVRREGGKVSAEDLAEYKPTWSDCYVADAFGYQICMPPLPNTGAYGLTLGLHLAEALNFNPEHPISDDPVVWSLFSRITALALTAPALEPGFAESLEQEGIDVSPSQWLTKAFPRQLAPRLSRTPATVNLDMPRHSNSIVVVDRKGNICVMTHTINAVLWGGTGIVVDGIPLPDSAGFQQPRLASIEPGSRVPHEIVDTIVLRDGKPELATASIGSSLAAETLRIVISRLAYQQSLPDIMKAPTHLSLFAPAVQNVSSDSFSVLVPEGAYTDEFLEAVQREGILPTPVPVATADALRGTVAAVALDKKSQEWVAVENPDIMVFHSAQ